MLVRVGEERHDAEQRDFRAVHLAFDAPCTCLCSFVINLAPYILIVAFMVALQPFAEPQTMNLSDMSHGIGDLGGHMGGMGAMNGHFEAQLSKPNHFETQVLGDDQHLSLMPPNGMSNQSHLGMMGGPGELHPHRSMDDPSMMANFHYDNNILHQDGLGHMQGMPHMPTMQGIFEPPVSKPRKVTKSSRANADMDDDQLLREVSTRKLFEYFHR